MNTRKFVAILIVLVVVVILFLVLFPKFNKKPVVILPNATPGVEDQLKKKLNGLVIPDDAEKIDLRNTSGGEGMGIATKTEVIADLPDLSSGQVYQVLLGNGAKTVLLGNMRQAKGGYILEYNLSKYPGYNQITVVRGLEHILEGTFK